VAAAAAVRGGPLNLAQALAILVFMLALAAASALGKVHQRGLVHKDIKPGLRSEHFSCIA